MNSTGTYTRRLAQDEIRLLRFAAGQDEENLICTLNIVSLKDKPDYQALSYTWGSPERCRQITIDGKVVGITQNLYDALHDLQQLRLQHLDNSEWTLWVDALCINQEDAAEVNSQVQQMGQIYRNANIVKVFLGAVESGHDDDLSKTYAGLKRLANEEITIREWWLTYSECVSYILTRPWFTRVWTVQEAGLSSNVELIYGNSNCDLHMISHHIYSIVTTQMAALAGESDTPEAYGPLFNAAEFFKAILLLRSYEAQFAPIPQHHLLRALMHAGRLRKATNPQDHVFGLLGACKLLAPTDHLDEPPIVDYTMPCEELFTNIFSGFLRSHHHLMRPGMGLNLLITDHQESDIGGPFWNNGYQTQPSDTEKLTNLPSWVPDYSVPPRSARLPFGPYKYSAGGETSNWADDSNFVDAGRSLVLQGAVFDTMVRNLNPGIIVDTMFYDSALMDDILADSPHLGDTTSDRLWAVRRTLSMDLMFRQGPVPDSDEKQAFHRIGNPGDATYEACKRHWDRLIERNGPNQTPGDVSGEVYLPMDFSANYSESFLVFESGRIGMGRGHTQAGDVAVVFPGICMPIILRKRENSDRYRMIGPAYVHGVMDGEIMGALNRGEYDMETFVID